MEPKPLHPTPNFLALDPKTWNLSPSSRIQQQRGSEPYTRRISFEGDGDGDGGKEPLVESYPLKKPQAGKNGASDGTQPVGVGIEAGVAEPNIGVEPGLVIAAASAVLSAVSGAISGIAALHGERGATADSDGAGPFEVPGAQSISGGWIDSPEGGGLFTSMRGGRAEASEEEEDDDDDDDVYVDDVVSPGAAGGISSGAWGGGGSGGSGGEMWHLLTFETWPSPPAPFLEIEDVTSSSARLRCFEHKSFILNPQPSTLNPQPSTLNPKP